MKKEEFDLVISALQERLEDIKQEQNLTDEELQELVDDPYYCEELYDIDDGDNLIQSLDTVIGIIEDLKPTE